MMSCRKPRPSGKSERVGGRIDTSKGRLAEDKAQEMASKVQLAGNAGSDGSGHSSCESALSSIEYVLEPVVHPFTAIAPSSVAFNKTPRKPTVLAALSTPSETTLIQPYPYQQQDRSSSSAFCMSAVRCHLSNVAPTRRCYQHPSNPSTTGVPIPSQQRRVVR